MSKVLKIAGFVLAMLVAIAVALYAIQAYGSRSAAPATAPVSVLEGEVRRGKLYWDARRAKRAASDKAAAERRERRVREAEERLAKAPKQKRRRLREYPWMSAGDHRGWNVPNVLGSHKATLTAFTRICIAESDGYLQDCVGIWQVMSNIRRTRCTRGKVRRITECEELDGQEGVVKLRETMLSVMRRSQPHILEMPGYDLRNERAGWIRNLTTDCENPPRGYPGKTEQERLDDWDFRYQQRCSYVVQLGEYLMKGKLPPDRPGVNLEWLPGRPITWGGRCESGKGSCDDPVACYRTLARVQGGPKTHNAFWCRPGRGCSDDIDPICIEMGYASLKAPAPEQSETQNVIDTEEREENTDDGDQEAEAGSGDNAAGFATVPRADGHPGATE
jgi:hypothetical protein